MLGAAARRRAARRRDRRRARTWPWASSTTSRSGVDAGGADAWALQDALALGTTIGAPPDSFNQQGQDWGLPPWRPDRLREQGYAPYRALVQGVLRHAGGLRIDHVMGLFRLWWVPAGRSAAEGTYVSYDADAMLGVLALEAARAGVVVVGEDLGTVEDRVRTSLEQTGVLGSAVLWFERDEDSGAFLPPSQWREAALATVTTHDLPTAAGFLAEEQVRVRDELGQLGVPVEQERARVREEREGLLAMLGSEGLLDERAATSCSPCTRRWPPRPAGSCSRRSATPSATCASRTCRAPSTSTRTGACPWPTARAGRSGWRSCWPRTVCAASPSCCASASRRERRQHDR